MSGNRPMPAKGQLGTHFLYFARGFATSRACSMNSCATGLSARLFRVTIPIGTGAIGSLTGKVLISGRLVGNLNIEGEHIVTKRPVANRLIRTKAGPMTAVTAGKSTPLARKASNAAAPIGVSGGGNTHNSPISSESAI